MARVDSDEEEPASTSQLKVEINGRISGLVEMLMGELRSSSLKKYQRRQVLSESMLRECVYVCVYVCMYV